MSIFNVSAESLFISKAAQSVQLENIAKRVLVSGLNQFSAKKYDQAISSMKRVVGLAPLSTTAIDAYDYMAKAYQAKGNVRAAVEAYQHSIRVDPSRDDTRVALGKVYTTQGQFDQALRQYESAFKVKPTTANRYIMAQGYLAAGRLSDAEQQFKLLQRLEPQKNVGSFGLGQTYAKQGHLTEAVAAFQNAIRLKKDDWNAQAELGYALTDLGESEKALKVVDTIKTKDAVLAGQLSAYIFEKTRPKMVVAFNEDFLQAFPATRAPGTEVAGLGGYLAQPGGERTFSMVFYFSKPMDEKSVENVANWSIARSVDSGKGDGYNFNVILPGTEIDLPPLPDSVVYDSEKLAATVFFTLSQNQTADGTLDPSHVKFKFNGMDAQGLTMDPKADEYTGFSGFA